MPRSFVTGALNLFGALGLLALGCASAGGVRPGPNAPTFTIRRAPGTDRAVYDREQTVRILGDGFSFQFRAPSRLEVRPIAAGHFLIHETFGMPSYEEDGEPAPLPARARQLSGAQTRSVVDGQNHFLEGPQLTARRSAGSVLEGALIALARGLHLTYPASPVAVGERWSPGPVRVSLEAPIAMTFVVDLSFGLSAIEPGEGGALRAVIEWRGEIRIPAFDVMGMTLEGRGAISGTSRIALADGTTGTTELDVRLSFGPRSTSGVITLLGATLKYRDEHEPATDTARRLIDGVRPIDPRS